MRKITIAKLLFALACVSIIYTSCKKDITERSEEYPVLNPTNQDLDAGTWSPVLLSSPDEFPVAAPVAIGTPAYTAE